MIIVFGGGGFIGRPLVRALLARGHRVRVVSRTSPMALDAAANPQSARADVSDLKGVEAALAGASAVINLASGGGPTWDDYARDFIEGAKNVAQASLSVGVRRLIHASSSAALFLGGSGSLHEADGADPRPEVRAPYARAKIGAEAVLLRMHREARLPVVILRPAVVVGEGGILAHSGLGLWPSPTRCVGYGAGRTPIPFVLVEDVAQAIVAAIDAPGIEGRTFNLAGDIRPTAREFVAAMAARTRRDFRFHPQSLATHYLIDFLKWSVKAAGGRKSNPFPSWRDLSSRALSRQIDSRLAKELLAWRPNADPASFWDAALNSHVRSVRAGDLRE